MVASRGFPRVVWIFMAASVLFLRHVERATSISTNTLSWDNDLNSMRKSSMANLQLDSNSAGKGGMLELRDFSTQKNDHWPAFTFTFELFLGDSTDT